MRTRSIITAIFFSLILFAFYFIINLSYKYTDPALQSLIPANATSVLTINNQAIIEAGLISVLIDSKDEETIAEIRQFLNKSYKNQAGKTTTPALNPFGKMIVFTAEENGKNYNGLIYEIKNKRRFDDYLNKLNSKSVHAARKENMALVLFSNEMNLSKLSSKIISEFENNKSALPFDDSKLITYDLNLSENGIWNFKSVNINIDANKNILNLDGKITLNNTQIINDKQIIKPNYLHIQLEDIPKNVNDTIIKLANMANLRMPSIDFISMNYDGVKVFLMSSSLIVYPKTELLINFTENFSADSLKNNEQFLNYLNIVKKENYFLIENEKLYIRQISPTSIYLGMNPKPEFTTSKGKFIRLKGNLASLTDIEASWLITAAIESSSEFQAAKVFLSNTEEIDLNVDGIDNTNKANLKGQIIFKKDKSALNEVLKLILKSGVRF